MSNSSRTVREREARVMLERATRELAKAKEAVEKLSFPVSPGRGEYRIVVRFERGGPQYTFLVLIGRTGKVYTTAVADGGTFHSFEAFAEWLRDKDVFEASPLREISVTHGGKSVELV